MLRKQEPRTEDTKSQRSNTKKTKNQRRNTKENQESKKIQQIKFQRLPEMRVDLSNIK